MKKILIPIFLLLIQLMVLPVHALDGGVESLKQTSKAFASVAQKVSPSVVLIQIEGKPQVQQVPFGGPFGSPFPFPFPFPGLPVPPTQPQPNVPQDQNRIIGQGSGFVFEVKDGLVKDKTYILTNNHVVEKAEKILVTFNDGSEYEAKVTGRDPQSDVAVIEIEEKVDAPPLKLADSSKIEVGEWVIAIGNPFGLSHTLTVGVVSAKGRSGIGINDYENFIQTDAAINPGNSGGPLVNIDGEVIGINTAIFSRTGGYMGLGFAIPSNMANVIAKQLINDGKVTRGYLGVIIQPLTRDLAESFGIDRKRGILVSQVSKNSPAEKAGLKQGDVIVALNGKPVKNIGSFRNQIALTHPGTKVELTVLRNGKEQSLDVTIGNLNEAQDFAVGPTVTAEELGMTVQTLTPEIAKQLGAEPGEGVVVSAVQPGSVAALAGIVPGTIILQVNQQPVKNAADFSRALKAQSDKRRAVLLIRKEGFQQFIVLSW